MISKYLHHEPKVDKSCFIAPGSQIIGMVEIGANSSIWHNAVLGGDIDFIIVGEMTNIQECSVLHCSHNLKLIIGNHVTIGHGAILHSCEIGDETLIGMGATVLDGARIGRNCLIGAGALVTSNTIIPDGSLVLGNPGKVKRSLDESEIENIRMSAKEYKRLASNYLNV